MKDWISSIASWLAANPGIKQGAYLLLALVLGYCIYFVTKKIFLAWLRRVARKTKNKIDDILFEKKVAQKISLIPPVLVVLYFAPLIPTFQVFLQRLFQVLLVWVVLSVIRALLAAINEIYEQKEQFKGRPIKGYVQTVTLLFYILGILVMIGILSGQSPLVLLSGVGALTAVLILVFRDTILSFVASLQITSNDLLRLGDWIEAGEFDADGNVVDIALHTVKVQNFDKTIVVIPTHKLLEKSFKNWRGMQESGGRRIKRAIFIDIDSIRFLDEESVARFEKIRLLKPYLQSKKQDLADYNQDHEVDPITIINGRQLTNVGTFRAYIEAYLKNHEQIHRDFTFLVRQLHPGPTGLPIEIYVFTTDTRWTTYEGIQADIFDHLFAAVREFDLKVYQYPSQGALLPPGN